MHHFAFSSRILTLYQLFDHPAQRLAARHKVKFFVHIFFHEKMKTPSTVCELTLLTASHGPISFLSYQVRQALLTSQT